jgi:ABC-type branched-subunit amino acid transport system substrate-binding protein
MLMPYSWATRRGDGSGRRRLTVCAAVAVTLAATVSCAAGGGPTVPDCPSPGVTKDEIKIGLIYPDGGPLGASLGAARSGIDARIQLANASGGVHGRSIVYDWLDDQGEPQVNDHVARDLVDRHGVFGLIEASTASSGGADYLRSANVPVAGLAAEKIWNDTSYPNLFTPNSIISDGPSVDTFGRYAQAQGGTRAAIVTSSLASASRDLGDKMIQSLAAVGIPTQTILYASGVSSPAHTAQQILDAQADVIVNVQPNDTTADILDAVRADGGHPKVVISPTGYNPTLLRTYGTRLAGVSSFLTYVPFEAKLPAQQVYLEAMSQYAPELQPPDQEIAYVSYIVTDLFLHGLDVAGDCPTRDGFIKALRSVKGYDAGGLLPGKIDLTRDWGQISTCYAVARVNQAGTAYEIVPNDTPGAASATEWCGKRLA